MRRPSPTSRSLTGATLALGICLASGSPASGQPAMLDTRNPSGVLRTIILDGNPLDLTNPFFQDLGTNGRSCVSCHVASSGWTITPSELRKRFDRTDGLDPIFRTVDGSNSPTADVSTKDRRREAYSMLLGKGVIRIELPIPAGAEFSLVEVDDPYKHASAAGLSLFRRPLPSTNLRFLTGVMWDARETVVPFGTTTSTLAQNPANLIQDLMHQAADATTGHAQALVAPDEQTLEQIVDFELNLATAQQRDHHAGRLDDNGAFGGAFVASQLEFYVTINDVLGGDAFGNAFNPDVMGLYDGWAGSRDKARASIARGAAVFNTKPIAISGVAGLNDKLGIAALQGHCTTCHDTPNVGNHSVPFPIDIGLSDASRRGDGMPLYTLRNNSTGATVQTTDPGRALITGKWADVNKFKGPILRGLAARPPYFHNGFADDLGDVVDFYNTRFSVGFTEQEKDDLVAFLKAL
jgi:hypothetical protein